MYVSLAKASGPAVAIRARAIPVPAGLSAVRPNIRPPRFLAVPAAFRGLRGFTLPASAPAYWRAFRDSGLRGLRGLGDTSTGTVMVNVGPGTLVPMSPADAQAYWQTGAVSAGSGGSASSGLNSNTPTYQGTYGSYTPAVLAAYQSSPTLAYLAQNAANVSNPEAPGYTPSAPQYTQETTAPGPSTTMVPTLDSYLAQLTAEMTGSSATSSVTAGGASNIAAQAQAYAAATGVPYDASTVSKYQQIFNNWQQGSLNLEATVAPGGKIVDQWGNSGLPLNIPGGVQVPGSGYGGAFAPGSAPASTGAGIPLSSGGGGGGGGAQLFSTGGGGAAPSAAPAGSAAAGGGGGAPAASSVLSFLPPAATSFLTQPVSVAGVSLPGWAIAAALALGLILVIKK